jgi:osmotically-inducible protein OsmY
LEASIWHGVVTLSGTVSHYGDKLQAEALAHQVPGVHSVRSEISLTTTVADDLELEDRLEDRLRFARADVGLTFPQIEVEVHGGAVSLTGMVKDTVEHAVALSLVESTDGVFAVRDKLAFDPALQIDDSERVRINKAIYRATQASSSFIAGEVPVRASFSDGSVRLMGAVDDEKTKEELISRVRDIHGIRTINDELVVRNAGASMQETTLHTATPCAVQKKTADAAR